MIYFSYLYFLFTGIFHTEIHPFNLGDAKIQIIRQAGQGKTLVHLHENESTALQAAKLYVDSNGGTLITLHHSGKRNIVFYLKKQRYEFDPNRIFTDAGIKKTLTQYGNYSPSAHREVRRFAKAILELIPPGKVIAVHNNQGYSIQEYFPKHPLASDAKALNYLRNSNFRNFFFVTRQEEFYRLKRLAFNVALQSDTAQDDGSLSYFLGKDNYINIEAGYGQLTAQLQMLFNA
ncbi:protein tyrosine phosphatase [Legionella sp. 16cNR16C]|uniref:protein tyrosine phosphatase n=1 Tax=Legionella sp. 16cNR16C TaxID=2905656 RepID=UPI001E317E46|nr:protein tyrosine phosphatase [Legionella sp. 16cNR16C]MCE3045494.1 protein tyrosine phosphatase [Legionella sp. 16cNR16C]